MILADPGVDAALVIFTPPLVTRADEVSAAILAAAGRHPDKPVLATLLTAGSAPKTLVGPGGRPRVPAFPFPEQAVRALGHVARYGSWLARPACSSCTRVGRATFTMVVSRLMAKDERRSEARIRGLERMPQF